jgi:hypothetical protein
MGKRKPRITRIPKNEDREISGKAGGPDIRFV